MSADLKKKAAKAIVNVFETGSPLGDYGKVTLLKGDSGRLTYGRSQTTIASGNLHLLIAKYCEAEDAQFADELKGYLEGLATKAAALDTDAELHAVLREAGDDPVMRFVQDEFFDRVYWNPSSRSAANLNIKSGLGVGVVYDSNIHGSWRARRNETTGEDDVTPDSIGEQVWIERYIQVRRNWLVGKGGLLARTVYRMDAFTALIDTGNWELGLPFRVRGVEITEDLLLDSTPVRASAVADVEGVGDRVLRVTDPMTRGDDVKAVQQALVDKGHSVSVDGFYGRGTAGVVRQFQADYNASAAAWEQLAVDGVAGPATLDALGL